MERKEEPQHCSENVNCTSSEQHGGENPDSGQTLGRHTEILNVGSRLPCNAENAMQGQGWGNWHDAGMKKWRQGNNFRKASPGNMQMASQEDFALDENVTEKASQWPLTLQWPGLIGRPGKGTEAGLLHELEVKRPGGADVFFVPPTEIFQSICPLQTFLAEANLANSALV